jgi:hypothetical protein
MKLCRDCKHFSPGYWCDKGFTSPVDGRTVFLQYARDLRSMEWACGAEARHFEKPDNAGGEE